MSNGRQANVQIRYNGKNISGVLSDYLTSFEYTDNAGNESDSISINLYDRNDEWIGKYFPASGDKLNCTIFVSDWLHENDNRRLHCGDFVIDSISASGFPTTIDIGAISSPKNSGFSATERSRVWQKITVAKIAQTIADRYGVKLNYDADTIYLSEIEQSKENDSSFLNSLCKKYGLLMKTYSTKIVIFDREKYKKKSAVTTIDIKDMSNWSAETDITGYYTGGTITYTDPSTEKDITFSVAYNQNKMLECNEKCDSRSDAEKILEAAINEANHGLIKLSIGMPGNPSLVAGQNVNITGIGNFSGKYFIDSVKHSINGGYTCNYELSKCDGYVF